MDWVKNFSRITEGVVVWEKDVNDVKNKNVAQKYFFIFKPLIFNYLCCSWRTRSFTELDIFSVFLCVLCAIFAHGEHGDSQSYFLK